jgi:hypothetical protein
VALWHAAYPGLDPGGVTPGRFLALAARVRWVFAVRNSMSLTPEADGEEQVRVRARSNAIEERVAELLPD